MITKLKSLYLKNREVISYLFFGVLTTLVNLLIYFVLTTFVLNVNVVLELQIANVVAWIVSVLFAYVTNRKYVFDSKNNNKLKELMNFFMARIATLVLDMVLMYLGVNFLKFNDKLVKVVSQVIVIVSNYILSKIFVFKNNRKNK